MRRVLILLFTVFYVVPTFAQAKHPFTFEDMMSLKRVGEPVPSPDGKWVLFSAVDVDLATNKKTPHIWIVPLGSVGTGASPVQAERSSAAHSPEQAFSYAALPITGWAQKAQRLASRGISLRHSGHFLVVGSAGAGALRMRATRALSGVTTKK
jgi:hypothetical protein